jgi:hypothetical protein
MPPRLTIVHAFAHQLSQLLPAERVTRTRTLALLVLGLLWAGTVSLPMLAASLPLPARVPSTERRLRRWLANPAVVAGAIWRQLLPALVADRAGQELVLVFDPTPHNARATLLVLGLVQHHRVLPLAWRVVPQQDGPWAESQTTCLARLMREVAAALPPGCTVTLLGDRGVTGSGVIDVCRALGWHYVLRLNAGPRHDVQVRLADDAAARPVWALVTGPGQRWAGAVEIFKKARWRRVQLTIWWDRAAAEPWLLLSDRPGGGGARARVPPPGARRGDVPGLQAARLRPRGQSAARPGAARPAAAGAAPGALVGHAAGAAHDSPRPPAPLRPRRPPGAERAAFGTDGSARRRRRQSLSAPPLLPAPRHLALCLARLKLSGREGDAPVRGRRRSARFVSCWAGFRIRCPQCQ